MNNKGFAVTTIIYAIILLLSLSMFIVLNLLKNEYGNQQEFVTEIDRELDECLSEGGCR